LHEESIDFHLREALSHLDAALDQSIRSVVEHEGAQKEIAPQWEHFFGQFIGLAKDKGKKARVNPLRWISFGKIR
jgi:hypothetical protein